jgi:hypothetical protein
VSAHIISIPESDRIGTTQNNLNVQPFSSYDQTQYITKLETQISAATGLPYAAEFYVLSSSPNATINITADLPAPFDLSANDFIITQDGNETKFEIVHESSHDQYKFGTITFTFPNSNLNSTDEYKFKLTIHNTDTETLINNPGFLAANYLKVFDFQNIVLNPINEAVVLDINVATAYYPSDHTTPRVLTALHVGNCVNVSAHGLSNFPTCGNIPSGWLPASLNASEGYIALFGQSNPVSYNASHLVDSNYYRYPVPNPSWVSQIAPVSSIDGLEVDGVQYTLSTDLNAMSNDCKQDDQHSVDITNAAETIKYDFNVSIQLLSPFLKGYYTPPSSGPVYNSECRTQPYSVSISKTVNAVVSHQSQIASQVHIRSVTYVPCLCTSDPAFAFDENVYTCDEEKTSFRLAVELQIDIPITSVNTFEGFTSADDILGTNYNCFHFPTLHEWTAEVIDNTVRTTATLYTDCLNIYDEFHVQDCNRFNKCKRNGTVDPGVNDYGILLNLRQCTDVACLQSNHTCPPNSCVDGPPDEVPVGISITIHECPDPLLFDQDITIDANATLQFVGETENPPTFDEWDRPTVRMEMGHPFIRDRMTTQMSTVLLCNIDSSESDCIIQGVGCPLNVEKGCNMQQWNTHCAFNGTCTNPIIEEYPLILNAEAYSFYNTSFNSSVCKTNPDVCSNTLCDWITLPQPSSDAFSFNVRPLIRETASTWVIDAEAHIADCQNQNQQTRGIVLTRDIEQHHVKIQKAKSGFTVKERDRSTTVTNQTNPNPIGTPSFDQQTTVQVATLDEKTTRIAFLSLTLIIGFLFYYFTKRTHSQKGSLKKVEWIKVPLDDVHLPTAHFRTSQKPPLPLPLQWKHYIIR